MGHKLTHPFHHHKDGESQQSGDAKTAQDGKEHPEHKKEGLIHRMEDYAKKENVKEVSAMKTVLQINRTPANSRNFVCRIAITSGVMVRMLDNRHVKSVCLTRRKEGLLL